MRWSSDDNGTRHHLQFHKHSLLGPKHIQNDVMTEEVTHPQIVHDIQGSSVVTLRQQELQGLLGLHHAFQRLKPSQKIRYRSK